MRLSSLCLLVVLGLAGAVQAQESNPKLQPRLVAPRAMQPAPSSQTQTPDLLAMLQDTVNMLVDSVSQLEQKQKLTQQQLQATQQQLQAAQQQLQASQSQLAALQSQYASHTHTFNRTSIGFTNVHIDGQWASYINKNTSVPAQTSQPTP